MRHALRPHTTIIIAESQFEFPFDLSHIVIRPYEHLGKWIDAEHAEMFRGQLRDAIEALLKEPDIDSPVYRLLPRLRAWNAGVAPILDAAAEEVAPMLAAAEPHAAAAPHPAGETDESISELMAMFREAKADSDWRSAVRALKRLIEKWPHEPYFQQQLALARTRARNPIPSRRSLEAREILRKLEPNTTTDPETLGLWGAVHKRLFELRGDPADRATFAWTKRPQFTGAREIHGT